MAGVELRKVVKRFGDIEVVHGIDLVVRHNEFVVLVGPSGCGKSTVLRMIAGLEEITAGEIVIGDKVINELAPKDRDIAMVFQDYALYPHLTVFKNLSFGLEMQKVPAAEIRQRVEAAAAILNITEFLDRKPRQLSGGQRQRVAMGRAIVRRPNVFLFDEPLSNLDAKLRTQMRTEIKKLHETVKTTVIYVTHDQVEAMTLAERIVVMRDGHVRQIGSPDEVYNHPNSIFVAGFIGAPTMNFIACRLTEGRQGLCLMLRDGTALPLPADLAGRYVAHKERDLILGLRPEVFHLDETAGADGPSRARIAPVIGVVEPLGSDTLFFFDLAGTEVVARMPPMVGLKREDTLPLVIDMGKMHLFDAATEQVV
ncbi:MAG: sn-glycerol-3-phosphate ABC transporter ATP-binding protein UgpC [Rhodospirillales bacterium]|jgi:multiple sugar transport system ATP-binding protein|nr:sn-glycerol-3-phosphate ABC transporter ATP-binding protein UgpC [Rhodospirillales bacterium]